MAKYMLIMRTSEADANPADTDFEAVINAMGAYNEAMITAGIMRGGDGLTDAAQGAVVEFTGGDALVSDGPYGAGTELFNGFWIIEVATRAEAIDWATRAPLGAGNKIEVRRITDESDFADFADNEYLQKEKQWRADAPDA